MRFSSIIYGRQEAKRWDTTDVKYYFICPVSAVNQAFAAKLVYASELADPPKHKRIGAKFYS